MKSVLYIFIFLSFTSFLHAQDELDNSFGNNGITISTLTDSRFEAVALQSDNKIIAAGYADKEMLISRFNSDGSPDNNFGTNGVLLLSIENEALAYQLLIQSDDKIIALGYSGGGGAAGVNELTLVRLTADGFLDNSFGTDGITRLGVSGSSFGQDEIYDALLEADGKIVVGGRSYNGQHDDFVIARFLSDGTPDSSFGTDGATAISSEGFKFDVAQSMVRQENGKYVLGGSIGSDLGMARFNNDGTVDTDFGTDGFVVYSPADDFSYGANDLVLLPDGKLLAGGGAFNNDELDNNFATVRFNTDGSVDNNYGDNGLATFQRSSNESIQSMILLNDGTIIAGGSTGGFNSSFAIARFLGNGNQDTNFGTNGWTITNPSDGFDGINAMVLLPDGDMIVAGYADNQPTIAKYQGGVVNALSNLEVVASSSVYPNPAQYEITVDFTLEKNTRLAINLVNQQGRQIANLSSTALVLAGSQQEQLVLPEYLATGHYYLVFDTAFGKGALPLHVIK